MFSKVRKLLRDRSPDWLNTEVNRNLLQNLSIPPAKGGWRDLDPSPEQVKPSLNKSLPGEVKRSQKKSYTNTNFSLPTVKGTPHWRRIKQVFEVLDTAPEGYTYNQLIEYVREATGKGCSRKLISKWKKSCRSLDLSQPEADSHGNLDRPTDIISATPVMAVSQATPIGNKLSLKARCQG